MRKYLIYPKITWKLKTPDRVWTYSVHLRGEKVTCARWAVLTVWGSQVAMVCTWAFMCACEYDPCMKIWSMPVNMIHACVCIGSLRPHQAAPWSSWRSRAKSADQTEESRRKELRSCDVIITGTVRLTGTNMKWLLLPRPTCTPRFMKIASKFFGLIRQTNQQGENMASLAEVKVLTAVPSKYFYRTNRLLK